MRIVIVVVIIPLLIIVGLYETAQDCGIEVTGFRSSFTSMCRNGN